MAFAAGCEVRQQQVRRLGRSRRRVAAFAFFRLVRRVVEPSFLEESARLVNRQHRPVRIALHARRGDGVAVITGATAREDGRDRRVRPIGPCRNRAEIGVIDLTLRILPRPAPRHAPQLDRHRRPGRAVERAQVGDHLIGLTMAQRAHRAADRLEAEAVARLAVLFHLHRLEPHAVAGRNMAILARKRIAIPPVFGEALRHARDASGSGQMQVVREFQPVIVLRPTIQRDPLEPRVFARHGHDRGAKLRVVRAKVCRIAEPGIIQPLIEAGMAIGAENLRRRLHCPRALMLPVAIDARARTRLAERMGDARQQLPTDPRFRACLGNAVGWRVIVHIGVAGFACAVADRHERLRVTAFAFPLQPVMRLAERAGRPAAVAEHDVLRCVLLLHHGVDVARILLRAGEITANRHGQERQQDQRDGSPRQRTLADHRAREREDLMLVAFLRGIRYRFGPLDGQYDLARIGARHGDPVPAEAQLCAGRAVDLDGLRGSAIDIEAQRTRGAHRDPPRVDPLDPGMIGRDGEIGKVDVAFRRPADADFRLGDRRAAHKLPPVGGEACRSDQKCHGPRPVPRNLAPCAHARYP